MPVLPTGTVQTLTVVIRSLTEIHVRHHIGGNDGDWSPDRCAVELLMIWRQDQQDVSDTIDDVQGQWPVVSRWSFQLWRYHMIFSWCFHSNSVSVLHRVRCLAAYVAVSDRKLLFYCLFVYESQWLKCNRTKGNAVPHLQMGNGDAMCCTLAA